ncbi:hypothetical protein EON82_16755 [bacterium]|nr:MAG: hypothetical protein EON82_16755 [bacterium]
MIPLVAVLLFASGQMPIRMDKVAAKLPEVVSLAEPAEVQLNGFLGDRVAKNERVRLLNVDEDDLLDGYRKRPGRHPWIGEHVGKFLHAATLAYAQTGDQRLGAKVKRVAKGLIATQEPDGYLGTYLPADRWQLKPGADWDVWSHKYCLIGLLTYYRYFGDESALTAARKVGDLLDRTFGPGKRSLNQAGTHVGMAATSVLEPVVQLYRATGEPRYLRFAESIVKTWEEPGGADILRGLTAGKSVDRIANGKAYEMLSNIVGLCELARATGNRSYLRAAELAWKSVKANELYITGTCSSFEHFHPGPALPPGAGSNVGETCVTVTWMQLNSQLLRLTGDAKYGAELERSAMNHLAGAQRADGAAWCYYTPLNGKKPFNMETNCCLSSGPRGMAMVPSLAYLRLGPRHFAVNLLEASTYRTKVGSQAITLTQSYRWDRPGEWSLRVDSAKPVRMALSVRAPEWADGLKAQNGWVRYPERLWKPGETVRLRFNVRSVVVEGGASVPSSRALRWGPFVLAYDEAEGRAAPFLESLGLGPKVNLVATGGSEVRPPSFTAPVLETEGIKKAHFVAYSEAGQGGSPLAVWLRDQPSAFAVRESRSRNGNVQGSIADGSESTFVVTFDGGKRSEDWYALEWRTPTEFRQVTFVHGKAFHDGGWFDTSGGKPRIEIRRSRGGPWEEIGRLNDYPNTTAASAAGLKDGQRFESTLDRQVKAYALRVVGVPASGDAPNQAFSSCAELSVR